jgi:hypothetical protein
VSIGTQKATTILGTWCPTRATNINAAETGAVATALSEPQEVTPAGARVQIDIDITSALASIHRCSTKSAVITVELRSSPPLVDRYDLSSTYVRSEENPADARSRGAIPILAPRGN